jgi:hypothetical protein
MPVRHDIRSSQRALHIMLIDETATYIEIESRRSKTFPASYYGRLDPIIANFSQLLNTVRNSLNHSE